MTKKTNHIIPTFIIILILASIFSGGGCVDDSMQQEEAFQQAVDTLYQKRITKFHNQLDSICNLRSDSIIQVSMDSIKALRLKEIEQLTRQ